MRRCSHVIWQKLGDEVVGLDLRSSRYFSLNTAGSLLWEALADNDARRGPSMDDLAAALCCAQGVDPDTARDDVRAFLDTLRDTGLVES